MKLWRRLAKKTVDETGATVRDGRAIKRGYQMQEMFMKQLPKTYPLLDALFARAGVVKQETPSETI